MSDENSPGALDRDLFGAPVSQIRDRWGRPSFKKTPENQRDVATLRAAGWSHTRIARFIGCDAKTLRKNFSRELEAGADLIEGQALQVLVAQMRQGKLSAVKAVLALVGAGHAAVPEATVAEADKPERLGKKETLERAAQHPSASWASRLQ